MDARVKQDYRFGNVSALVGRRFDKNNWTPVPAELEAEAAAHPFLEVRGASTAKVAEAPAPEFVKSFEQPTVTTHVFPPAPELSTPAEDNASPAAIALASKHGLDLTAIPGTGAEGKITVGDVKAALPKEA